MTKYDRDNVHYALQEIHNTMYEGLQKLGEDYKTRELDPCHYLEVACDVLKEQFQELVTRARPELLDPQEEVRQELIEGLGEAGLIFNSEDDEEE